MASCRLCHAELHRLVVDLGNMPLANGYLRDDQLADIEPRYPLRVLMCSCCSLVQLDFVADPSQIFGPDYGYFSSYSATLLDHSASYADMIMARLNLTGRDRVVEIASNDGYLLGSFASRGLDVLGIEPAAGVAAAATQRGLPTVVRFFGADLASELAAAGRRARLVIANNVLAHVPDVNDFLAGLRALLEPGGMATVEFHHLLSIVQGCQFDTIYHEHYQYFSLAAAQYAMARNGLRIVDVEEVPTQGGSLRVFARREEDDCEDPSPRVAALVAKEESAGLRDGSAFEPLAERISAVTHDLRSFLTAVKQSGRTVVCYGAAAKGNTLLNACGVTNELVDYAVDRSPHKQGLFLPGTHIPIHHPDKVAQTKPDYLLILAWNLRDEIIEQMSHVRRWGGQFLVPIPRLDVIP